MHQSIVSYVVTTRGRNNANSLKTGSSNVESDGRFEEEMGKAAVELRRAITPPVLPLRELITPADWNENVAPVIKKSFEYLIDKQEYNEDVLRKLNAKVGVLLTAIDRSVAVSKAMIKDEAVEINRGVEHEVRVL